MASQKHKRSLWLAAICGGTGLVVCLLYFSQFLALGKFLQSALPDRLVTWENAANDWLIVNGKKAPVSDRLVCIGIDDASTTINEVDLEDFAREMDPAGSDFQALKMMGNPWPWPREVHRLVLEKLIQAGAKMVIFDVVFQSQTPYDEAFAATLEKYRDHVVLGSNFTKIAQSDGGVNWTQIMPNESLIPLSSPVDDRVGFVNFTADPVDQVVRETFFRTTHQVFNGYVYRPEQEVFLSLAARALEKAGLQDKIPPGLRQYAIHFADPTANSLRPRPVYELFVPRYWKSNFNDGSLFKDKIVIVGPYAEIMHDVTMTPFHNLPGPHMHLQAMNAVLENAFIGQWPLWLCLAAIAFAAMLAFLTTHFFTKPFTQLLSLMGGSGLFLGVSWFSYNSLQSYPITVAPLLALNGGGLLSIIYQFVLEQLERARTRRTLERYVSRNLVSELLDNQDEFLEASMGKRKPVTVLFSDLRGFTSMTESADPHALVAQLNEYLTEMVRCVFNHQGTLDKFIGDAVMAVWGNVRSYGLAEDARLAVNAALEMRTALATLNARWRKTGLQQFHFGIGLNHGDVITGDIGSPEKSEFTVIGDPINLASRMEGLTKSYYVDLLVGEDVKELIADRFVMQSIDRVRVKGKGNPTEVFAVHQSSDQPITPELSAYLDRFADSVQLYRSGNFSDAQDRFTSIMNDYPDDPVCRLYIGRCHLYLANPPGDNWDGVFTMKTK